MGAVTILVEANFSGSTWTDITPWLESEIQISGGRQDELSQADPNQCSFQLDNLDGRFTPGKATGAYYPNVKVGVPVRVSADVNGSGTSRRFTGFVDSWQLTWDDDTPRVQVSASSVMSRLGLLSERKSAIEEEILVDAPAVYYPLSEPAGSTSASDRSGNNNGGLATFGDGTGFTFAYPVTGGAEGMQAGPKFAGGRYLQSALSPSVTPLTMEAFFLQDTSVSFSSVIAFAYSAPMFLAINGATGKVRAFGGGSTLDAGPNVLDGRLHHAAVTLSSGTLTLYVDGASVGTASVGASSVATAMAVGGGGLAVAFSGVVAHAAIYSTVLSAARIAARYNAGINAFRGETVSTRFSRYASWGKVASSTTTSTTPVAADTYVGASLVDLLHNLETTENGVLYDERDGTLTLKGRRARYTAANAASFDVTAQQVESSFTPTTDRQGIANEVTVTTADGTTAYVIDASSQAAYGVARIEIDTLATEVQDTPSRAQWELLTRATPKERVPSLGIDILNCGLSAATLLALTVGSRVAVTNPPPQASGPGDYFIEGWSETFDPTSYMATFNVSPAQPWVNTLILDNATKGVLDSTYVLAY